MDQTSNAFNRLNGRQSKDLDRLSLKKLSNHREMKAATLKKKGKNKNTLGKVVSFRNITTSSNRRGDAEQPASFLKIIGRNRKIPRHPKRIVQTAP